MPVQWEDAPKKLTRRSVCMSIYGSTGSGKTSLALTAPGPIALIHCSEKLEGIVQKQSKIKEIKMHDFGFSYPKDVNKAAKIAQKVMSDFREAWDDAFSWARTIIVDTHTDLWELLRVARFGTTTPKGHVAHLYAPVNAEWLSLLKQVKQQDSTNVILIGSMREQYRNDKPTGNMEMAGQKDVARYSDVVVKMERNILRKDDADFQAIIQKGWYNALTEGMAIDDDMITFPFIMSAISELGEEEWEE